MRELSAYFADEAVLVTFKDEAQRKRFFERHVYKGKMIHGFDVIQRAGGKFFYRGMPIPRNIAVANLGNYEDNLEGDKK